MGIKAFVGDFADLSVLLPLAAAVAALLAATGWWRGLVAWAVAMAGVLLVMLLLKLGLAVAADQGWIAARISPSGHTAAACAIYGGLGVLLLHGRLPPLYVALLPVGVAMLVGVSRLHPWMHSPGEVAAGAMVGLLGVAGLALMAGPPVALRPWPYVAVAVALMLAFHGDRLPAEAAIRHAARLL